MPCHLYYPGVGASGVFWLKAHVLQNSNWLHFALMLRAGTGCDIRGDGWCKSGVLPLQVTYNQCTPYDACWKASQSQYVNCSLVEHSFATKKHMETEKYVFIQYYSWFDLEMTLIWLWADPAVEPQQRATPTHVTFSTQVLVHQVFCDFNPMFHKTPPIDHFLHWF